MSKPFHSSILVATWHWNKKTSLCCHSNPIDLQSFLNDLFILNYFKTSHCIAERTLISDRHLRVQLRFEIGMFPSMIIRILCVACWFYAQLQRCCAYDKLKEEQTARMIKCHKTCAHLAKNLVGTQPVYEVRNAIWDNFSFTWISYKFTSHYTFILLLYYIALIETKYRTTSDSRTHSAKIAGMSL